MTSVTAGRFHEPSLLLNQTGGRLWGAGRHSVIRWPTQKCDRANRIDEHYVRNTLDLDGVFRPAFAVDRAEILYLGIAHALHFLFGFIGKTDHDELLSEFFVQGIEFGNRFSAWAAPGRPKVDQDKFA